MSGEVSGAGLSCTAISVSLSSCGLTVLPWNIEIVKNLCLSELVQNIFFLLNFFIITMTSIHGSVLGPIMHLSKQYQEIKALKKISQPNTR